ncbi:hypothetical protein COLO4_34804 [Corchorus olitorius]|uniref:Galactose oxidase/kelch, beta-propeller n=1 Tax=Corchorus olitorius TaxID=93759 RepID=A0A1R3GJE5_9ROSI|nr:hypothetical protein COLO4_34804 [Corchorus olitorius]
MTTVWRGLFLLPLLIVVGNCNIPFLDEISNPSHGLMNFFGGNNNDAPTNDGGNTGDGGVFFKTDGKGNDDKGDVDTATPKVGGGDVKSTNYKGIWELFTENSGVSAMHLVILPKIDQALMFDATIWNISKINLPPPCRKLDDTGKEDCFAHSVLMDIETAELRPLRIEHDTWCSSGALDINGQLVSTGGYNNGSDTVRYLADGKATEWEEFPGALGRGRWYSTQVTLGDGRFMVFGGRNMPSYEFVPAKGQKNTLQQVIDFPFLAQTNDKNENNLYPHIYLSTDGNLFIFANDRSILLNPNTNQIVFEFPVLPGGSRNYPASGSSCLLPIKLKPDDNRRIIPAEVLICGGAQKESFTLTDFKRPKEFPEANRDCARIDITKRNGKWKIQNMPSPRVMGDAVLLPNGEHVLIVNGAKAGTAGWDDARNPNLTPVLYKIRGGQGSKKFKELKHSDIPRMYHSSFALLPDAKVMIAGSNTNPGYYDNALFPTETRIEKFSPHYFDPNLDKYRVQIQAENSPNQIKYGHKFTVQVTVQDEKMNEADVKVTIYYPAFTTHGISMNQRLIELGLYQVKESGSETFDIDVQAPMNGNIAPPGYYMLFVNFKSVPCRRAIWVQLL